ncbi:uncharacterized protein N7483_011287 [Penicillium malachiteum]|uniref:uncharacterized protein n=1 Tax=Penicillium malachiteum TaxID=1324776 RepID=UPI002547E4D2|nr:uncharacterized protein N7483_011287 [Penicillium malachiteum]KAJ5714106.1 hypothetical protein N7483_011287 [Penicillium malachiteum]
MNTRFAGNTKDPAVNVTKWVLFSTVILGVLARLETKLRLFKRLTLDDCFIIASLTFCAIQSICVSMAVGAGHGNHFEELSTHQFDTVMKYLYSSTMLYIASLCFSMLSLVIFIRSLTPSSKDHLFALLIEIVTGIWAVVSIFGYAFQCSVPNTWDFWNGKCFNIVSHLSLFTQCSALKVSSGSVALLCLHLNIVTDFLILAQGFLLLYRVQAAVTKRLLIASLFLPRLLVIGAVLAELIFTHKAANTTDPTYTYCDVTILQETSQCLSMITACWGQLKPFLSWLKSSGLRIQDFDYTNYANAYGRSNLQSPTQSRSRPGKNELNFGSFPLQKKTQILVTRDWEVDSQSSQAHIIQEPHTWVESTSARQSPVN